MSNVIQVGDKMFFHPGYYLQEWLEEKNMSVEEFADKNMIWRVMATLNKKENKYGCRCAYCGYLFITEEHEFNTGRWDKKGRWLRGINCPCCTDVIPLEYMEKLQTTADEERFHKMMEEYPDGFAQ